MKAKELIAGMEGLARHRLRVYGPDGEMFSIYCHDVMALPPDQRTEPDQGNVIVWTGSRDVTGRPEGITISARAVKKVRWIRAVCTLVGDERLVRFQVMGREEDDVILYAEDYDE